MARQCVLSLEENERSVYLDTSSLLLKVIDNVLKDPRNPKFRNIRIANPIVSERLLPAIGAMECLFEMGFQEGEDKLILPDEVSLEKMRQIQTEISMRRQSYLSGTKKATTVDTSAASSTSVTGNVSSSNETPKTFSSNAPAFILQMWTTSQSVLEYEDKALQQKALVLIPTTELEINVERKMRAIQKAIKLSGSDIHEVDVMDLLLLELLSWFKNTFFSWVDRPKCQFCNGDTRFEGLSDRPEELVETSRVEVYVCNLCHGRTLFPRYTKSEKLLKTRKGRCGEWAQCFTLMCRAMGWEARHVYDVTDHVWTEVYSIQQQRWLHCDPCENVCDKPLMYEAGWGKKLSYVIAYSYDDIQDVTWRYTSNYSEVLERRNKCSELQLLSAIYRIRELRQNGLSLARKTYLRKRLLLELVEFLTPQSPSGEYQGRSSGSLAWRLARGETGEITVGGSYTWTPSPEELSAGMLRVAYSCEEDRYFRGQQKESCLLGWQNGVAECHSVFRKEEKDWKVFYLSRTEGSSEGTIMWKFDFASSGHVVEEIKLKFSSKVFENGIVHLLLCSNKNCSDIATGETYLETRDFDGSTFIILKAVLSGGKGDIAWQHAQIFRQQAGDGSFPFEIVIKLRKE